MDGHPVTQGPHSHGRQPAQQPALGLAPAFLHPWSPLHPTASSLPVAAAHITSLLERPCGQIPPIAHQLNNGGPVELVTKDEAYFQPYTKHLLHITHEQMISNILVSSNDK